MSIEEIIGLMVQWFNGFSGLVPRWQINTRRHGAASDYNFYNQEQGATSIGCTSAELTLKH